MNPMQQNAIELRDIHLPDPVSWWPLAAGWWISLLLIIALIIIAYVFIPKLIKKLKHQPARKLALKEFNIIQQEYMTQKDNHRLIKSISILLRRVCMTYDTRNNSASLTGQAWADKLSSLDPQKCFSDELMTLLLTAPYQKQAPYNAEELLSQCECWFKSLPEEARPCYK